MSSLQLEGCWPGPVTLRKGWARAESRPWNDAVPMAHLRLVRGNGSGFIGECVEALTAAGATAVLSPPLPRSAQRTWRQARFQPHSTLALLRRPLDRLAPPNHIVTEGTTDDVPEALRIDAAAFDSFWRFDAAALSEAMAATPLSVLLVVGAPGGGLAGFAVTGAGSTLAYLQRVAVDPRFQATGIGRSLVRASARWAQKAGATSIMLNTQTGNEPALRLYESEGYDTLEEPLEVLINYPAATA
ncbi:MAG TPA: GNAT family N-acetyltransferase [Acidimicrobiia bacterium]|nr:GNAT family N-acetyltransferase [Acidimicrobiia bacterium]